MPVGRGVLTTLETMRPGQKGRIVAIRAPDKAGYRRLLALGLVPGATVTLIRRGPAFVFTVGYTTIAVDGEMASDITVFTGGGEAEA